MTKTKKLVIYALFTAIIFLMAFTPVGYIKIFVVDITFLTIPVIVGAILMGPAAGAFLGGVFGLTSFIQCFGNSPFGAALLGVQPVYTFILCMIPRILMGCLCAYVFKLLNRNGKGIVSFGVASLAGAILNTAFFVAGLILLFGNSEYIRGLQGGLSLWSFIIAFVGLNGLIEAIVCTIVGSAVSKALYRIK